MAKRVPPHEKPYRPVDEALVQSVLNPLIPGGAAANGGEHPADESLTNGRESLNGGAITQGGADSPVGVAEPEARPSLPPPLLPSEPETDPDPTPAVPPTPPVEKLCREKRVLLSRSEEREVERLVADMADKLCTPLKLSHVLRATVLLLRQARGAILTESERVGPLKRPHNGEAEALGAFEHDLAEIIDRSLRNTTPLT